MEWLKKNGVAIFGLIVLSGTLYIGLTKQVSLTAEDVTKIVKAEKSLTPEEIIKLIEDAIKVNPPTPAPNVIVSNDKIIGPETVEVGGYQEYSFKDPILKQKWIVSHLTVTTDGKVEINKIVPKFYVDELKKTLILATNLPGKYVIQLHGMGKVDPILEQKIIEITGAQPPPGPGPTPGPIVVKPVVDPIITPAPIAIPGLRVMIAHETADQGLLTQEQRNILFGSGAGSFREFCVANCAKNGKDPEFFVLDKDQSMDKAPQHWQQVWKHPRTTLPWLTVSTGTTGYEGPLPATTAETIALIQKLMAVKVQ